jgi:hypothetical protein
MPTRCSFFLAANTLIHQARGSQMHDKRLN